MKHRRLIPPSGAFTLVEMLVAITLIGILATIVAVAIPRARTAAHRTQCASNMRQIGTALLSYAADNGGFLPETSHSDSTKSWLDTLLPYLGDSKAVRVCPADHYDRQTAILRQNATSYLLNETVFAPDLLDPAAPRYDNVSWLGAPGRTMLAFISNRPVSRSWDHTHSSGWSNLNIMASDVAVDIHGSKSGLQRKATDRIDPQGSANYLYADGHVENITAAQMNARFFSRGINPAEVPAN